MAPIADIFDAPTRLEDFSSQFGLKNHSSPSSSTLFSATATASSSNGGLRRPIAGPSSSSHTIFTLPSSTLFDGPARPRHSIAARSRNRTKTVQKITSARPHGQMATYSSYLNDIPLEIFDGPSRISGQRYRAPRPRWVRIISLSFIPGY
ncbi:hypothetical protein K435DRAFT_360891 [Dendrothele bispora CBS 962.96]|uniref:Uncharacterized protein n=1 Tax=Dendrothele bispora (strain CBS 962.96) TaxID=1314807 RepID=A0A4S8MJ01_DENBC|nr:hypothetical protein K435DRAFT_360891 [Dendrothele bispora CBS 962.96]